MKSKPMLTISFTGIANFLGVIGIIGSLLFVGLELRQSHRIALGRPDSIPKCDALKFHYRPIKR